LEAREKILRLFSAEALSNPECPPPSNSGYFGTGMVISALE
jgi:hypothetical protein